MGRWEPTEAGCSFVRFKMKESKFTLLVRRFFEATLGKGVTTKLLEVQFRHWSFLVQPCIRMHLSCLFKFRIGGFQRDQNSWELLQMTNWVGFHQQKMNDGKGDADFRSTASFHRSPIWNIVSRSGGLPRIPQNIFLERTENNANNLNNPTKLSLSCSNQILLQKFFS